MMRDVGMFKQDASKNMHGMPIYTNQQDIE